MEKSFEKFQFLIYFKRSKKLNFCMEIGMLVRKTENIFVLRMREKFISLENVKRSFEQSFRKDFIIFVRSYTFFR